MVKVREEFEASTKKRRAELQAIEDRQTQREANLDRKATLLDEREAAAAVKSAEAAKSFREAEEKNEAADRRLQELSRMTHAEARREILSRANAELRADAAILSRRIQEAARR